MQSGECRRHGKTANPSSPDLLTPSIPPLTSISRRIEPLQRPKPLQGLLIEWAGGHQSQQQDLARARSKRCIPYFPGGLSRAPSTH